jgi:hypothetical protein
MLTGSVQGVKISNSGAQPKVFSTILKVCMLLANEKFCERKGLFLWKELCKNYSEP